MYANSLCDNGVILRHNENLKQKGETRRKLTTTSCQLRHDELVRASKSAVTGRKAASDDLASKVARLRAVYFYVKQV